MKATTTTGPRGPLPEGALAIGGSLLVSGIATYGFLSLAARALGPDEYAPLAVLWTLTFLVGPGMYYPLEQEVSRGVAERAARGLGSRPFVRMAAGVAGLSALVLAVAVAAASGLLLDHLFGGDGVLVFAFGLVIGGYALEFLARGTLAGHRRFWSYGAMIGSEALTRLVWCGALAAAGVATAGPYGVAVGVAPFLGVAVSAVRERGVLADGPPAAVRELTRNLGFLLSGSIFMQVLINASPIAVQLLASPGQSENAGRLLNGLVVARVPLYLFQAVQASLLPKLTGLATEGRRADFRTGLLRVMALVTAVAGLATLGGFLLGPWVMRVFFGAEFELGRRDMAMLAAASGVFMMALTLAQSLVALSAHSSVAAGWLCGVVTLVGVTVLPGELLFRVERGFLAGTVAALAAMALLAAMQMRQVGTKGAEPLVEALSTELVEP